MVLEDNDGGVDEKKALLNANRWYFYMNEMGNLIKGGYLVKVVVSDKKKVIWEVVDNHVVEGGIDHDKMVLRGFG